uniref:TIL domain-containing protein n=1 Tax=Anopheles funestus TaxID=62324 RepID=A0A4Y0BN93_ANOFN
MMHRLIIVAVLVSMQLQFLNAQTLLPASPLCKQNEYSTLGSRCMEPKCNSNRIISAMLCQEQLIPGCFCLPGYARNKDGICVYYKIGGKCLNANGMNSICTKFVDCNVTL